MRNQRTAIAIVNELKKMIVEDKIKKLPGEPQLAEKLGVSRTVLREAIKILEYEGIVKSRRGSGTYVINKKGLKISFSVPIEINTDNPKNIIDLLEVRRSLEERAIILAVETATDVEIGDLEEKLIALEDTINEKGNTSVPDYEFHKKIVEISHNIFLLNVYDVVFSALEILWKSPLGMESFGDKGLKYHRPLFEEIKKRNRKKALSIYNKIMDIDMRDIRLYIKGYGF
jgi:GntR family transcriptional repressor for pyruvate dehydrogenase complex